MPVEDYLLLMKTIPIRRRGVVREHKLYKVYLPIDMNDLWNELHRRSAKFDVVVLISEIRDVNKPDLLKLVDKIVMRNRVITRKHKRFKLYQKLWRRLNRYSILLNTNIVHKLQLYVYMFHTKSLT